MHESIHSLDNNLTQTQEIMLPNLTQGYAIDTISAGGYIRAVKKELSNSGEVYTHSELGTIRDWLKKAYSEFKGQKNKELLSEYRSSLARISRLQFQAKMTEGKTLDEVVNDNSTNEYQKFILTKSWLVKQKYTQLYSENGIKSIERTQRKLNCLIEDKIQTERGITPGEYKAFDNAMDEMQNIRSTYLEQNTELLLPIKPFEEKNKNIIRKPEQTIFQKCSSYIGQRAIGIAFVVGIGIAAMTIPSRFNPSNSVSASPTTQLNLQKEYSAQPEFKQVKNKIPKIHKIKKIRKPFKPKTNTLKLAEKNKVKIRKPYKPKTLQPGMYEIKGDDNLFCLAREFKGDGNKWREIAEENNIKDIYSLKPGTIIKLEKETNKKNELNQRLAMNKTVIMDVKN